LALKRLLDTNAYVALKRGDERIAAVVRSSEELVFSIVVIGELLFGFRNGDRFEKNLDELEQFLDHPAVAVLHVTRVTADRFGRLAALLRKAGTPVPTNDIWIAAQTQESGAELVTFDKHFERIPALAVTIVPSASTRV
jgi:tRNA(fMet)-specific endonuclease VapC